MRKHFPGYYKPSKDDFRKLWSEGLFVFDTNVLLDLYRFSESTVNSLLQIMETLKDRIWIPYQVSEEYHKNLNKIISGQVKKYGESIRTLLEFKKQIDEKRSHPFLELELHQEIEAFCEKFDSVLDKKQKNVKELILSNPTKERLADILENSIGEPFTDDELKIIFTEGESRYFKKQPPGYLDNKKGEPDKYGDLIVWKEILKKNKSIDQPVIFVTGDTKEDWFQVEMGMTIGPRPELISELKKEKNNLFYCYSTDSFLKYSNEYLDAKIGEDILEEVGDFIEKSRTIEETESESEIDESTSESTVEGSVSITNQRSSESSALGGL
ncbi:MAG: PIN domain-containing protein [Ekhidna sp.]|uniref:PIN domain-containing protein n=1 Tax=Ekhidna sp. TaxID=2608089 RepID=UPI0032EE57F4